MAAPFPRLRSKRIKRISPGNFWDISSTISAESSVEPSSTTIISRSRPAGRGARITRSRIVPTYSSSLKSGIRMETRAPGIPDLLQELIDFDEQFRAFENRAGVLFIAEIVPDHAVLIDDEQVGDIDLPRAGARVHVGDGHLSLIADDGDGDFIDGLVFCDCVLIVGRKHHRKNFDLVFVFLLYRFERCGE